jgi:replicative superfamily II helicase
VRQLAAQARPIVELWPSQRMALEAGLLDPARNALVVRTPTSSGKTRMAEAAIVDAISAGTLDTCCVYIVPFRALATEVEAGLGATLGDLGIRVSSLFGGYETSELENHLLSNSNVLILTPEKLDLVLRADPTFAVRLKLIVVDEGQLLGDENARAIRLELLLTRLRRAAPDARVLFLSAVVPNVDQVARWLAPGAQEPLDQSWRPTRLLTGVFRWSDDRGRIDYEGQTDYFVPYVLMRQIRSLGLTPVRREPTKPKPWPKSVAETAAELALHFQRIGPVAVFAAQPRNCAAVCKALVTGLRLRVEDGGAADVIGPDGQAEIDELVTLAAKHLGSQHELVGWLRLGIAYHHARVPEALRVRIEDAFRSGALQILVCTTTLSQGVNLPVKTLIVSHTLRDKDEYVSVRDFWNIAGRAGRANHETRGQVILVESPTGSEAQRQRGYLDHRNIACSTCSRGWHSNVVRQRPSTCSRTLRR